MLAESRQAGKVICLHKYFQIFSEFLKNHRLKLLQHYLSTPNLPCVNSIVMFTALLISVDDDIVTVTSEDHSTFHMQFSYSDPAKPDNFCHTTT
jgi:hypothetical protein